MPGASFEAITGRLGIGAIAFLGFFLFIDGLQIGVFQLIEENGKTVTWGLIGLIPTVVVTYIVGAFCLGTAEAVFSMIPVLTAPSTEDLVAVAKINSPLLQQTYAEHLRTRELLLGSSVAFLVLAAGSFMDISSLPFNSLLIGSLAVGGALSLSGLSLLFSIRAKRAANEVADAAKLLAVQAEKGPALAKRSAH